MGKLELVFSSGVNCWLGKDGSLNSTALDTTTEQVYVTPFVRSETVMGVVVLVLVYVDEPPEHVT